MHWQWQLFGLCDWRFRQAQHALRQRRQPGLGPPGLGRRRSHWRRVESWAPAVRGPEYGNSTQVAFVQALVVATGLECCNRLEVL